ncbi:MAG: DUF1824 family protein [Leptolyngbyaceae cyanobacterium HOT.MB2.61]|jgi:hypothetical protein|nr:DUF1824 family protein [Leptolyngbyaceae cyanobacterium HOT.MB2.61]
MSTLNADNLTLESARKVLRRFICLDQTTAELAPDRVQVRQALLLVANHSDYQIFGICADSTDQANAALKDYLNALGYEQRPEVSPQEGAVYVKFNPRTGRCHADSYTGNHRGVLVSCQSAYDEDVNETFGHLPLDLWS